MKTHPNKATKHVNVNEYKRKNVQKKVQMEDSKLYYKSTFSTYLMVFCP